MSNPNYPRPARSILFSNGWSAQIETAPGQYQLFGRFAEELDAKAAAEAVCTGLKEMDDYERTNGEASG